MTENIVLQNTRLRPGGFLQSEASRFRSRDEVCIEGGSGGAGTMVVGTVLGKATSSGKYVPSPNTGSDGSQIAIAVLFDDVDATAGDIVASVIARDAEVRAVELTYDPTVLSQMEQMAKWAQLLAVGIVVRWDNDLQVTE
jgi:hypothetical protein